MLTSPGHITICVSDGQIQFLLGSIASISPDSKQTCAHQLKTSLTILNARHIVAPPSESRTLGALIMLLPVVVMKEPPPKFARMGSSRLRHMLKKWERRLT